MNKILLKMFGIDLLIELVIAWLASTIKNTESKETQRVKGIVMRLHLATGEFLKRFPQ